MSEGNAKLQANQFEEAIKCYDDAIRLNPENAIYYANRYSDAPQPCHTLYILTPHHGVDGI